MTNNSFDYELQEANHLEIERRRDRDARFEVTPPIMREREFEHPWTGEPGWITETYKTDSHKQAQEGIKLMELQGWSAWIVSNVGDPGFVVYRENQEKGKTDDS